MVWLLVGVLIVLAPILIGFLMPVRYEGATTVAFDRSLDDVWDALQDAEAHPMTGRMMKSVESLPSDGPGPAWREDMGRGEVITVTTTSYDPPTHMVREMRSAAVRMTSTWEYRLEPDGEGSVVSVTGVTDIHRGTWHTPLFRVMMVLGGGVKKGLDIQLDMVAATLGTEARPTSPLGKG